MTKNYVSVNGTDYAEATPKKVIDWLETARQRGQRIRIFYGDTTTGRDWMEEYDTMGRIGRSGGKYRVPLLLKNRNSMGGTAILTDSIVRITIDTHNVYKHPEYHQAELFIVDEIEEATPGYSSDETRYRVQTHDDVRANFGTRVKAERYIEFMKGERNSK